MPFPSTEVAIFDEAGKRLGVDEVGEICARGPQVMAGYWNRPDDTAKVLTGDGWLRTGDLGHIDPAGFVFMEDRKKDVIVVSGFKVYPNEVEDAAVRQPGVREAAAIGIPDAQSGEVVKLFVVRKDPSITEAQVIAHARANLTGYKVPRKVEFMDELPKSNVGKVLRRELKERETAGRPSGAPGLRAPDPSMRYAFAADAVMLFHFCFIAFALLGSFLVAYKRWVAWLHLPALAWGAWIEASCGICPLTPLENHFRELAGRSTYGRVVTLLGPDHLSRGPSGARSS